MHSPPVEKAVSDEAIAWFSRLHSGHATPEDHHRFEIWSKLNPRHAEAYSDVEKFWALLDDPARRIFEQERSRPVLGSAARKRPARLMFAGFALVAGLLWLPNAARFWASDYHTGWGERREITLDDGSRISLNTHSALSVDYSPQRRQVKLVEGEAYFQVTHDPSRPFIVITTHGMAKVTGTAFNVYQQDERVIVTVSEGRVRVSNDDGEHRTVDLTAGLQASSDRHGIGPVRQVAVLQVAAWRNGLLVFEMRPLAEVVDELNRYFPGKILIADPRIRNRIVSGAFDLTNPYDVLTAIEKTLRLGSLNLSSTLTLLYQPIR
ncbi:MAG: FecR family protein [Methylococcaceae bacterium]|nr:FecR family protein [Methylococcaceae bacterium]